MVSTKMIVHCDRCGAEAEVRGLNIGPDQSSQHGSGHDDYDTTKAQHVVDCPHCGIHTQRIKPQGS
jgi:hypothetical protein